MICMMMKNIVFLGDPSRVPGGCDCRYYTEAAETRHERQVCEWEKKEGGRDGLGYPGDYGVPCRSMKARGEKRAGRIREEEEAQFAHCRPRLTHTAAW